MQKTHHTEKKKRSSGWVVGTGLAALYAGSVGPVSWLLNHGFLPSSAYSVCIQLYRPLDMLNHTALRPWFDMYLSWWQQA